MEILNTFEHDYSTANEHFACFVWWYLFGKQKLHQTEGKSSEEKLFKLGRLLKSVIFTFMYFTTKVYVFIYIHYLFTN